jgi:hypothetical protein
VFARRNGRRRPVEQRRDVRQRGVKLPVLAQGRGVLNQCGIVGIRRRHQKLGKVAVRRARLARARRDARLTCGLPIRHGRLGITDYRNGRGSDAAI